MEYDQPVYGWKELMVKYLREPHVRCLRCLTSMHSLFTCPVWWNDVVTQLDKGLFGITVVGPELSLLMTSAQQALDVSYPRLKDGNGSRYPYPVNQVTLQHLSEDAMSYQTIMTRCSHFTRECRTMRVEGGDARQGRGG